MVNITLALRTTRFLDKEREYMPWQTARTNMEYMLLMLDRTEVYGPMQVCVCGELEPSEDHVPMRTSVEG